MSERILDHVGIAVASLDDAIPLWEPLIGANSSDRETVASQNVEVVFIGSGTGRIELLAPTGPDSPLARFLARHGPGVHHLCYRVLDIRAALADFKARGYELIDHAPRAGAQGHLVAFVHPRATGGVLIELLEARTRTTTGDQ